MSSMNTVAMMSSIADVGRDAQRGGYSRPVFSTAELELRSWFTEQAEKRGLEVETDRNGALWAWLDAPGKERTDVVVTGSHLDSVPGGGAFDGPLGVASALAAVDTLRERGHRLERPLAVAVFPEEEGSRFGLACLGSGLMAGTVDRDRALALRDDDGNTLADLARGAGIDPTYMGHDPARLARIGAFVELHVEQGRGLVDLDHPVAVATSILGHGRWRVRVTGQGNHAGTTAMDDRRDPMAAAAGIILAAQDAARAVPEARATVGKLRPVPGGANVIASTVDLWLDIRHPDDAAVNALLATITARVTEIAAAQGCAAEVTAESYSPTAHFHAGLRDQLSASLPGAPLLPTGAGHDAGVLAPHIPTGMLFVRNPSGISHSPEEYAEDTDVESGTAALADVLVDLTSKA
ncbi:allantoate amidohydrolase [Streptomyces cavernicola]|uniref:Allantoate amidohydrolase n=1 Tax=Streptomyces cavernicola TaxID=3043613 RepID=A0ABT6SEP1_9ACTN|nr:allantoate amidohydrolase [Streptomyces sp. B-S-A6]MDI3406439.1 allantoate amidohydrolase [Streptomyces sp. B-S-A6]